VRDSIKIAILDLYEGEANEGMRCILQLVNEFKRSSPFLISHEIFDVRGKLQVPDLSFDVYISSGGPGSPLTSVGSEWENRYFRLMEGIFAHNHESEEKKFVFLICHSFQIFCRQYGLGKVSKRRTTSFGVMPVHKTRAGLHEHLLNQLQEPFWVIDSRDFQITQPDIKAIHSMGGHLLCIEKERPLIPLERAVMAIRINDEIFGTQFHPEADYHSMFMYLLREDKKKYVIGKYGERKYQEMLQHLNDPEKVKKTYHAIIPAFLNQTQAHYDRIRQASLQPQL
jgi:homoserine O-succinyltransferase/O-acetyltransferase